MSVLHELWFDSDGAIVSAEIVIVATVLVLGMVVGLTQLQEGVLSELSDLGNAFNSLSQSYAFPGLQSQSGNRTKAFVRGSRFNDADSRREIVITNARGGAVGRAAGFERNGQVNRNRNIGNQRETSLEEELE